MPQSSAARIKSAVALGLTFAAGMVDIVSFVAVYHMFVAHMTGDTVHLGHDVVVGDMKQAVKAGIVIFSFVAGSIAGRSIIEAGARRRMRKAATASLLIEAAIILIVIWSAPHRPQILGGAFWITSSAAPWLTSWTLALLAAAMGMQTATLSRVGPLTVHTTFVTGMLNKLAQEVSRWMFWVFDEIRGRASWKELLRGTREHASVRTAVFMLGIWCFYLFGSVAGTWMTQRWNTGSLYLPAGLLVLAAGVDQVRPLSLEEEKDQG